MYICFSVENLKLFGGLQFGHYNLIILKTKYGNLESLNQSLCAKANPIFK